MRTSLDEMIELIPFDQITSLAIIGNGAAGKSFFAEKIIQRLNYLPSSLLNSDDYLLDKTVHGAASVYQRNAYFTAGLDRDIYQAFQGKSFYKLADYQGKYEKYRPEKIKIFEGIGLPFTDWFQTFDYKIFIHTSPEDELKLRLNRDVNERHVPMEKVQRDFSSRRAAYDQYQQIWKNKCQLCLTNHLVSWHYEIIKQDDQ